MKEITTVRKRLYIHVTSSSDINECLLDIHECDVNATCNNTIGNYECQCNTGFEGDGFICTSKLTEVHVVTLPEISCITYCMNETKHIYRY